MDKAITTILLLVFLPGAAIASDLGQTLDLTRSWAGFAALMVFVFAYGLVVVEEYTGLRKPKPIILGAGIIWVFIGIVYAGEGLSKLAEAGVRNNILEYAELFLFLLTAMTYIESMTERGVFDKLRVWLLAHSFSYRQLFWLTGLISFFLSPIADNLTTALITGAVVMALGVSNARFVSLSFINIVVAANAGGAFSPFGDITTLMVWQRGIVDFFEFFTLFIPSVVNFMVPAVIMHFAVPKGTADPIYEKVKIKKGGVLIMFLFIATIGTTVAMHNFLHLPPALGMMTGLSYLMITAYFIKDDDGSRFDVFKKISKIEWDTLMFFFGIILSVGGLGFIGYLELTSEAMYVNLGATLSNSIVGALSAILGNIPVMFAVISMNPEMPVDQWLLVTLTAGVGGSLLSIGSAAGVALMGQSKGRYTFFSHLKWTPVIAVGYVASIWTHILLSGI